MGRMEVFDITGFVFNANKILVIFPKHYFDNNDLLIKNKDIDEDYYNLHKNILCYGY